MSGLTPLQAFRQLYRTVNMVFKGDLATIEAARRQIRDQYEKNSGVTDPQEIQVESLCQT